MKKKIIMGLVLAFMLTAVVGCGGAPQSSEKPENNNTVTKEEQPKEPVDLVLKDSNYTIDDGYVHYVVAIENPNTRYMPQFVNVKVTGKRADGTISFSDDWVVGGLAPGSTTYWANQAGGDAAEDDSIEITVSVDSNNWEKSDSKPADVYVFDNVSVAQEEFGGVKVTGEITLTDASVDYGYQGLTQPMLVCVFKDAEGNLVGGFDGFMFNDLVEGTPTAFDISSYFDIEGYDTVEMYANPWM